MKNRRVQDFETVSRKAAEFVAALHHVGGTVPRERLASRELSLSATKIEEALMWAQKHIVETVYADEVIGDA